MSVSSATRMNGLRWNKEDAKPFWETKTKKKRFSVAAFLDENLKRASEAGFRGPGGGIGVGCGVGIGLGVVGGVGYGGSPWNHFDLVFGVGMGCGVGLGFGFGQGLGFGYDLDSFVSHKPRRRPSEWVVIQI